ncbi:MAG TPA: hypothetical protein PKC85_01100 [Bacteroidia bacterium]|jgi:hypothetical protein|nr:hypothetical protein [Bacteroidia bacterium]HMU18414.1 hypothetical protein [Bacteroidia bacterium]
MFRSCFLFTLLFVTINCEAQWLKLKTNISAEDNLYDSIVAIIADESGNVNRLKIPKEHTFKLKLNNHYQITFIKPDAVAYKFEVNTHLPVESGKKNYTCKTAMFLEKLNPADTNAQKEKACKTRMTISFHKDKKAFSN